MIKIILIIVYVIIIKYIYIDSYNNIKVIFCGRCGDTKRGNGGVGARPRECWLGESAIWWYSKFFLVGLICLLLFYLILLLSFEHWSLVSDSILSWPKQLEAWTPRWGKASKKSIFEIFNIFNNFEIFHIFNIFNKTAGGLNAEMGEGLQEIQDRTGLKRWQVIFGILGEWKDAIQILCG